MALQRSQVQILLETPEFLRCLSGFPFEAGSQALFPVVSHSMSVTLMPIFERFVLFFIIMIFYLLFKENLSELQPCLRKNISECSILKISWREDYYRYFTKLSKTLI